MIRIKVTYPQATHHPVPAATPVFTMPDVAPSNHAATFANRQENPTGRTDPDAPAGDDALDALVPGYRSYPTADLMNERLGASDYAQALGERRCGSTNPLALYAHVPFCHSPCWFCAGHRSQPPGRDQGARYLDALERELDLVVGRLGGRPVAGSLYLGGGTPTWLDEAELERLMHAFDSRFAFHPRARRTIEIDPRSANPERIARLVVLGFDRLSLGVQDLDPDVQLAINRVQPLALTRSVIETARRHGVRSIGVELVHGLPRQSADRFGVTLERVIELRPERIAVFGYRHRPARFAGQRLIDESALPTLRTRTAIVSQIRERLHAAGYSAIGLDHFALPDDDLAIAHRNGRLHRDLQGFTTRPDRDVLGFGPGAIGDLGDCLVQNAGEFRHWARLLEAGRLPIVRGLQRTRDDLLRARVISSLLCTGRIDIDTLQIDWLIDFRRYFADELVRLSRFVAGGLMRIDEQSIDVMPDGRTRALRSIAAVFDRRAREAVHSSS